MDFGAALPVVVAAAAGAAAGAVLRVLLSRLRRGVALRPGALELASALLTGLGVGLLWPGPTVALAVWAGLLAVGLGAVDVLRHRLPDALTLPAIPITALLLIGTEVAAPGTGNVLVAGVVAVVLTGLFWAVATAAPRAIGLGDVKLVPTLGLLTGYLSVASAGVAITVAFVLGAVIALVGLATRRLTMTSAIPFGPCLLAGTWLVIAVPGIVAAVV